MERIHWFDHLDLFCSSSDDSLSQTLSVPTSAGPPHGIPPPVLFRSGVYQRAATKKESPGQDNTRYSIQWRAKVECLGPTRSLAYPRSL